MGISSYFLAKSNERAYGGLEDELKNYKESARLHKLSIAQLKRHQKSAISEAGKTVKKAKSRISTELAKPISRRINNSNRKAKELTNAVNKEEKMTRAHADRIFKFNNIISKGFRSFKKPNASRRENLQLVEKNEVKIQSALLKASQDEDSALTSTQRLASRIEAKKPIQIELVAQNQKLLALLVFNTDLIRQNYRLNQISKLMRAIDSVGVIIDSLNERHTKNEKAIKQEKIRIRQLHTSILSNSSSIQKLTIQNCQLSHNRHCERDRYNLSRQRIETVYKTKYALEEKFLQTTQSDGKVNRQLAEILTTLHDLLDTNRDFISLFQESRLGAINSKLSKSNQQSNQLMASSSKSLLRLRSEIYRLKNEIRNKKGK